MYICKSRAEQTCYSTCCDFSIFFAVLVAKVMSAHDKGSHAEVEVKVKKVLYQSPSMKIRRGSVTLYPESWTTQGCTCPILNPGQPKPLRNCIVNIVESQLTNMDGKMT